MVQGTSLCRNYNIDSIETSGVSMILYQSFIRLKLFSDLLWWHRKYTWIKGPNSLPKEHSGIFPRTYIWSRIISYNFESTFST